MDMLFFGLLLSAVFVLWAITLYYVFALGIRKTEDPWLGVLKATMVLMNRSKVYLSSDCFDRASKFEVFAHRNEDGELVLEIRPLSN